MSQPTRDDLVLAWGDHVLSSLRPRARAAFTAGRFVSVEDGVAVFALPNSAHVEHAAPLVTEVADAISRHVGTRVGLRLVTETGDPGTGRDEPGREASRRGRRPPGAPAGPPSRDAAAEVPEPDEDVSDFEDMAPGQVAGRHDSLSWAEGRLLEAFPGTEEVP